MKRVLAISDIHAGSRVGLTPTKWQQKKTGDHRYDKLQAVQSELWGRFTDMLKRNGPFDVVLCGGDAIDGRGKRSGGTEQITQSLQEQTEIATGVFDTIRLYGRLMKTMKFFGVFGTPYHVSEDGEDWENALIKNAGFEKVGSHEWIDVEGVVFDLKHKIGGSTIPHGRGSAISKELLWNELWAGDELQPMADVLLRGHVHYHSIVGGVRRGKMRWGMTLPALQGMGTKFGSRQCSGLVDWGAVIFDCDNGGVDFHSDITTISGHKTEAITA